MPPLNTDRTNVRRRELRAEKKAGTWIPRIGNAKPGGSVAEDVPLPEPSPWNTEPIGVPATTTTEPLAQSEGAPQPYHCETCAGPVKVGDAACGVCQTTLNWEGII